MSTMKQLLRNFIVVLLNHQLRRLRRKNQFKVIAVAGSIGKTSTKTAIAQLLSTKLRVRYQTGNYNVPLTVPLVFFGLQLPSLLNPIAWIWLFIRTEWQLYRPYPYDVVVVELGTDEPGYLAHFKGVIDADIGVLTAITAEHMEFFKTLSAVAKEEAVIGELSKTLLLNNDLCPAEYLHLVPEHVSYGTTESTYCLTNLTRTEQGYQFTITCAKSPFLTDVAHPSIAVPQLYSICAAAAVAQLLELSAEDIANGIAAIMPVAGRLQLLDGKKHSVLIDDTYNASPEAVKAALRTLYEMPQRQKIALLGNMNELGEISPSAHAEIGALCDPSQLDLVVTLGPDANKYLAPAAEKQGCTVRRCDSPYDAGRAIDEIMEEGAVVLLKGSQNRVFAEEAVKRLLERPEDIQRLVRQSKSWMSVKKKQFPEG